MGMFDNVVIHNKLLPNDAPQFLHRCPVFQTYDLGRGMRDFTIGPDGVLMMDGPGLISFVFDALGVRFDPIPVKYVRKRLEIHATNLRGSKGPPNKRITYTDNGEDMVDISYVVQIRNGKVSSIKELNRTVKKARPIKEM